MRAPLLCALVFTVFSAGCAPATRPVPPVEPPQPTAPPAPEEEPRLDLEATLDPEARTLDVRLTLPLGWVPGEPHAVRMTFWDVPFDDGGGNGFARFLRQLDVAGHESPWTDEVEIAEGRMVLTYRVLLGHADARPGRGIDEVPRPTAGGMTLIGRAFVPASLQLDDGRSLDVPVRLRLSVPDGWEQTSTVARRGPVHEAPTLTDMANAIVVTGRFHDEEVQVGRARVRLVTADYDEAALGTFVDLVRRALEEGSSLLGPLPPVELFVVYDRNPLGIDGGLYDRSIVVLSESPPGPRATADGGVVTVHELAHLWNRSDAWWINEGFARYFELLFKLRLDAVPAERAQRELLRVIDDYLLEAEGRAIAEAEGRWGYEAGAVAAFCADVRLREEGTNLFVVHQAAREATTPRPFVTIEAAAFDAALAAASPAVHTYLGALITAPGPVDVHDCLRRAGLAATAASYRGPTDEALAARLLEVASHGAYAAEILTPLVGSPLSRGDLVVRAGTTPVLDLGDLAWAVRSTRAGAPVRLTVVRGTGEHHVLLDMPQLADAERTDRRRWTVRPQGSDQASPLR